VLQILGDHLCDPQSAARRNSLRKTLLGQFHDQRAGLIVVTILIAQPIAAG
jgi:hypothetical protein